MIQIKQIHMPQNEIKQFAFEVLDVIDELIKPEIKSSIISKFWGFFTGHAKKKILQKPDNEIIEKLMIIQKKLNSRFQDLDSSIEINEAEKLGAVKIPMVGNLARIKNLTQIKKEAEILAKDLF